MKKRPRANRSKFLVLVSRFNRAITEKLLTGARRELRRMGTAARDVEVAWVPGAFELPQAGRKAAATGRYRGIVCLGAVIKGETSHDRHIAASCAIAIQEAAGATGVPFGFGVITAENIEQAMARCRTDGGRNLGADAARAAAETALLYARFRKD